MNKFNFDTIIKKLESKKSSLPKILANSTKKFFLASWEKQGWDDNGITKWAPRKKNKKAIGRAVLVKSGALRRAVNASLKSATFDSIKFSVDLPYAQIHNEGGVINKQSRDIALRRRIDAKGNFIKQKTNINLHVIASSKHKRVGTTFHHIGSHSINMPQRKYMGDSASLRKIQIGIVQKEIDKIFK